MTIQTCFFPNMSSGEQRGGVPRADGQPRGDHQAGNPREVHARLRYAGPNIRARSADNCR